MNINKIPIWISFSDRCFLCGKFKCVQFEAVDYKKVAVRRKHNVGPKFMSTIERSILSKKTFTFHSMNLAQHTQHQQLCRLTLPKCYSHYSIVTRKRYQGLTFWHLSPLMLQSHFSLHQPHFGQIVEFLDFIKFLNCGQSITHNFINTSQITIWDFHNCKYFRPAGSVYFRIPCQNISKKKTIIAKLHWNSNCWSEPSSVICLCFWKLASSSKHFVAWISLKLYDFIHC